MEPEEIRAMDTSRGTPGDEQNAVFLREIAAQLADLNETLRDVLSLLASRL